MSRAQEDIHDEGIHVLHPKYNEHLVGHVKQEKQLVSMFNKKSLPHAILLTGHQGIGKATLAYRLAKFLLNKQEDTGGSLFGDPLPPESLYVSAEQPIFKRVIAGGHPDLLVIEGDDIKIEEARKVSEFLALTPAEGDWRVVIIDSAEALNRNAANALLKIVEEPPSQAVLLLISHNPGRLLATIRSRCRTLRIPALTEMEFAQVIKTIAPELEPHEYTKWALLSGFSPGIAAMLMENQADTLYKELLKRVTIKDTASLHAFAERFARKDAESDWQILKRLVFWLIHRATSAEGGVKDEIFSGESAMLKKFHSSKPLFFWTEIWEKTEAVFAETENLYLDRKQAIISLIRALS